ncbi:unnamed protein product [Camellia sinensis]
MYHVTHFGGDIISGSRNRYVAAFTPRNRNCTTATVTATATAFQNLANNILLDNNFCVKVANFGLSRLFPTDVTHVSTAPQGTPGYVDPEYHQCYQLTDKSDVYSFGVVLIELISSLRAVDIRRHGHEINLADLVINRIQNRAFDELIDPFLGFESDSLIERMTTFVAELAFQCLQHEKEMRPTMDEVLEGMKEIQEYKYDNIREEIDTIGQALLGGGIVLLFLLIVITQLRKEWNYNSSYISSRDNFSNRSLQADTKGGSVYFGVPIFSYTELEEAIHNFDPTKEYGDGGFGTVYHGWAESCSEARCTSTTTSG